MVKLSEALETFVYNLQAEGRSPSTIANYKQEFAKLIKFVGDSELDRLKKSDLVAFMNWLQTDYRSAHGKRLSQKSIKNIHGNLHTFFTWTLSEHLSTIEFDLKSPKAYPKAIAPLTTNEIKSLLRVCLYSESGARRPTGYRDRLLIALLLDTGLRISEALSLQPHDVDLKSGRITVIGKGNKERIVFMGKKLKALMSRWLLVHKSRLIFGGLNRHAARQVVGRLGKRTGIANLHPHVLRHTAAVRHLRHGGSVYTLQMMLGHSDLAMCKRYLQLSQGDLSEAQQRASPLDNL